MYQTEFAKITSENFEKLYRVNLSETESKAKVIEISDYQVEKIIASVLCCKNASAVNSLWRFFLSHAVCYNQAVYGSCLI